MIIILLIAVRIPVSAQDTTAVRKSEKKVVKILPLRATMLAAALPGTGQIYTRKYWKVPLVYAGFGALGYAAGYNSKWYNTYTKAYQDFTDKIPETDSYLNLIVGVPPKQYDPVLYPNDYNPETAAYVKDQLLNKVDYYKRYRDLSMIGIAAWYLLTLLDANVDASLTDFDVSENINISVAPFQIPSYNYAAAGVGFSLQINF